MYGVALGAIKYVIFCGNFEKVREAKLVTAVSRLKRSESKVDFDVKFFY